MLSSPQGEHDSLPQFDKDPMVPCNCESWGLSLHSLPLDTSRENNTQFVLLGEQTISSVNHLHCIQVESKGRNLGINVWWNMFE